MKITKILLTFFVTVSIISCKKDDDNQFLFSNSNLAGIYEVILFKTVETQTLNVNGLDIVTIETHEASNLDLTTEFSEDGSYTTNGVYVDNWNIKVQGQLTDEDDPIVIVDNETGSYSTIASPKKLILNGDTYDVTLFTENEVRASFEETSTGTIGESIVYTEEIRLVRQ